MKKFLIWFLAVSMLFCSGMNGYAKTTPIIAETKSNPPDCYYHYDGQIWIYSTSRYKSEVKKAVKLLNKKFNVFRITKDKNKRDLWLKDAPTPFAPGMCGATSQYRGLILLFKPSMKKLSKKRKILTVAHELCHAAGLDHANSRSSLMYPYIDKTRAKNVSSADIKALKKAKSRADSRNLTRLTFLNLILGLESKQIRVAMNYENNRGKGWILAFKERGMVYSSTNPGAVSVTQNGIITVTGIGTADIIASKGNVRHVFRFRVY